MNWGNILIIELITPSKLIQVKIKVAYWLNPEYYDAVREKNILCSIALSTKSLNDWRFYKNFRNKVNRLSNQLKQQYYEKRLNIFFHFFSNSKSNGGTFSNNNNFCIDTNSVHQFQGDTDLCNNQTLQEEPQIIINDNSNSLYNPKTIWSTIKQLSNTSKQTPPIANTHEGHKVTSMKKE